MTATDASDQLDLAGAVSKALQGLGLAPVLVGGMALVILGSRRVTRDFDFVIPRPDDRLGELVAALYDLGFELVSRLDENGDVAATIDQERVAAIRLRIDAPSSAYFFHRGKRLRVDLLFDFPVAAADLLKSATTMKVRSHVLRVASEEDLLRLKRIAKAGRSSAGDAQDIEFLEARHQRPLR